MWTIVLDECYAPKSLWVILEWTLMQAGQILWSQNYLVSVCVYSYFVALSLFKQALPLP